MDYTDIEKFRAITIVAKARLLEQEAKSFWLKLKPNDPNTTPENFEQLVQVILNGIQHQEANEPKSSENDFDTLKINTPKNGDTDFDAFQSNFQTTSIKDGETNFDS